MKKLLTAIFLISVLWSCKKDDPKPSPSTTTPTHNIKYQVLGFIDTEITYDGTTIAIHNDFDWDYTFTAPSGKALSLSAKDLSGTQSITIKIYQDGQMTKSASGYGVQTVTDVVK